MFVKLQMVHVLRVHVFPPLLLQFQSQLDSYICHLSKLLSWMDAYIWKFICTRYCNAQFHPSKILVIWNRPSLYQETWKQLKLVGGVSVKLFFQFCWSYHGNTNYSWCIFGQEVCIRLMIIRNFISDWGTLTGA